MRQIQRTALGLHSVATLFLMCQPTTSFAIQYLDVEFASDIVAIIQGSVSILDQKSAASTYPFPGTDSVSKWVIADASAFSASARSELHASISPGYASIEQTTSASGSYVTDEFGNILVAGNANAAIAAANDRVARIHFRVDETDGDVVFQSHDWGTRTPNVSSSTGTQNGSFGIFLVGPGGVFLSGAHLGVGEWTIVLSAPGNYAGSFAEGPSRSRTQFAASWTFDGVFPGETKDSYVKAIPDYDFDKETEIDPGPASDPFNVAGVNLTIPTGGSLGVTDKFFVGIPTQVEAGPSKGAEVTGYKVTSQFAPLTSMVIPDLLPGAENLVISFGGQVLNVIAGQEIDFGPAGVAEFVLEGFDYTVPGFEPGDLVMGLQFANDGLASLTAIPTLFIPPGDFSLNGVVNAADYTVWRDSSGSSEDYLLWKSHFGEPLVGGSAAANNVPEPSTLLFGLMAFSILAIRRR